MLLYRDCQQSHLQCTNQPEPAMPHDESLFHVSRRGFLASSGAAGALAAADAALARAQAEGQLAATPPATRRDKPAVEGWTVGRFDSMRD